MMDGPNEISACDRPALRVGDRDDGCVAKMRIEGREHGKVLPPMQCRYRHVVQHRNKRELQLVDVEMQNVEFKRMLHDLVEHHHVIRDRIVPLGIQPKRSVGARNEVCARDRVAACEQGHIMTLSHEFFREVRDDPFSSAIESWGHALDQR
jgi:hypothetical protein